MNKEYVVQQIEKKLGKKIDLDKDISLKDNADGTDIFIQEWNLPDPMPDLKTLPKHNQKEYEAMFGKDKTDKDKIKDMKDEIDKLNKEIVSLKAKKQ